MTIFIFILNKAKQDFCHLQEIKLSTAYCSQTVLSGFHGCLRHSSLISVIKDGMMNC